MNNRPLLYYWFVLYRRKKIIAVTCLSAMAFALVLSLMLPKIYEPRCVFFVPSVPQQVVFTSQEGSSGLSQSPLFPAPDDDVAALHIGILKSLTIAREVSAEFPDKTIDELKKDVDFVMNSQYFLEVYVRDRDPELAANVANAYPKYFNEMQRSFAVARFGEARQALETQLADLSAQIAALRKTKEGFQQRHGVVSLDLETQKVAEEKSQLQSDLNAALVGLRQTQQKIKGTEAQLKAESEAYVPSEAIETSPVVDQLRKTMTDLEVQIAGLRLELTADHPTVVRLQAQYDQTKKNLEGEIARIVKSPAKPATTFLESLRRDLAMSYIEREVSQARGAALREAIKQLEYRTQSIPTLERTFEEVDQKLKRQEALLETLSTKLEEVGTQEKWLSLIAVVVDKATPPASTSFPNAWLNTAVAAVLGLIGGIIYAFFVEYLSEVRVAGRLGEGVAASGRAGA